MKQSKIHFFALVCLTVIITLNGALGQSYTQVPYNFSAVSTLSDGTAPQSFLPTDNTIDWLAAGANVLDWQQRMPGSISCESVPLGKQHEDHVRAFVAEDTTCKLKFALGLSYNDNGDYKTGFRILKSYAETCYNDPSSFRVFAELDGANHSMSSDAQRYPEYREWLKTVLYLNQTDPMWYCECVKSISSTFWWDERMHGPDSYAGIAIAQFLLNLGKCPQDSSNLAQAIVEGRREAYFNWRDTCAMFGHDTNLFPFDTTIPTLHELGLDILYGPNGAVKNGAIARTLADLRITSNPFTNLTQATIELPEMTYLRFELFDLLGHVVQGDERGRTYLAGSASFTIDGKDLAPGIYFVRVSTSTGETRTARVVRQ